jgi:hypothetical protein
MSTSNRSTSVFPSHILLGIMIFDFQVQIINLQVVSFARSIIIAIERVPRLMLSSKRHLSTDKINLYKLLNVKKSTVLQKFQLASVIVHLNLLVDLTKPADYLVQEYKHSSDETQTASFSPKASPQRQDSGLLICVSMIHHATHRLWPL